MLNAPGIHVTGRTAIVARLEQSMASHNPKLTMVQHNLTTSLIDIESAENCNPRIFLPGYQRKPNDCRTDNYVTRAACN